MPFEQDTSFLIIGERTNANGSKRFREAMLAGDWDTCVQMANEQVAEGAHVLDVCVDYVGRDGTATWTRSPPLRHPGHGPLVLDSTEPPVMEAGLQHIGGRRSSTRPTSRTASARGSRLDRVFTLAAQYGAAVICLLIDEEGQARDVEWKLRVAHRIHDIATERYGLRGHDLIFDALTFPLSTGDEDLARTACHHRGHPAHQGRAAGRPHGARRLQRLLRPQAGGPPRAQQRVPARVRGGRPRRRHRPRRQDHAAQPDPRRAARGLPRPHLRPPRPGRLRPAAALLDVFADVKTPTVEKEDRSGWPVEERLKHRIIDGDRDGLEADLDEALAEGCRRSRSSTTSCSTA